MPTRTAYPKNKKNIRKQGIIWLMCLGAIIAAAATCYRLQPRSTGSPTALFPSETAADTALKSTHPGLQSADDPQSAEPEPPVLVTGIMPAHTARDVTNTGAASLYNTEVHLVRVSSETEVPLLNPDPASSATAEDIASAEAATSSPRHDDVIVTEEAFPPQRVVHDCSNDSSGLVLATLKEEASWSSAVARVASQITMVTQMSPGRLKALQEQCKSWSSIIAVTVYVPLLAGNLIPEVGAAVGNTTLAGIIATLGNFHEQMETEGPCKLDMVLYSEEVPSLARSAFYPVNTMRNLALRLAQTEVVLLNDIDFIVSSGLVVIDQYAAILQLVRLKQALVLPALEPKEDVVGIERGIQQTVQAVRGGKAETAAMMQRGELKPFHLERWDLAHRATNYTRWVAATGFYAIQYEHDFEPYVIVSRELVPAYDERLRGYFENKAVHLRHMAAIGFRFLVHSGGYVVHMPHPPSKAREWLIDPVNLETRNLIQGLGTVMRVWIDNGTYVPVTTASCTRDELTAAARRYAAEKSAKPLTIITAIAEVLTASQKVKQMQEALQATAAGPETAEAASANAATDAATVSPAATDAATVLPAATDAATLLPAATDAATVLPAATDAATLLPAATDTATVLPAATDAATLLPAATDAATVLPAATDAATVLPAATDAATVLPAATDAATLLPAATDAATVLPAATDAATLLPAATDAATVLPAATDAATLLPAATDAATVLPAATDAATILPAAPDAATVLPAATDAATLLPAAKDAATVIPVATSAATDIPAATDATTVLPATTDAVTVLPATAIDAIALPQNTVPVIGSIIGAQKTATGSEGSSLEGIGVKGGSLHEQATIATAVASLELASAKAADQATATNASIPETVIASRRRRALGWER